MEKDTEIKKKFKFLNNIRNLGENSSISRCCRGNYTYSWASKVCKIWELGGILESYKDGVARKTRLTDLGEKYWNSIKSQLEIENKIEMRIK